MVCYIIFLAILVGFNIIGTYFILNVSAKTGVFQQGFYLCLIVWIVFILIWNVVGDSFEKTMKEYNDEIKRNST